MNSRPYGIEEVERILREDRRRRRILCLAQAVLKWKGIPALIRWSDA